MSPRSATTLVFFVNGAVAGSWIAQIPWVVERFGLSKTAMGFLLFAVSAGVIVIMPAVGQAIVRHGSHRMVAVGGTLCTLLLVPVLFMPEPLLLGGALFSLGAASATMDVAMNAHGVAVEKAGGRAIMSSLHAGWAFGGVAGAGVAAVGATAGADPRLTVALTALALLLLLLASLPRLGRGSVAEGQSAPGFTLPSRGVVLLAVLAFLVMVTEGAMADWGGLYLRQDTGAAAGPAALAYACFAGGMTAGRLLGDRVNDRVGPVALLRGGALLTAVPLAAFLLVGLPGVALAGLFVVGLGVANGVPLMFSAAGRQPDAAPGPSIAAVSSMGSLGFLAGPPVIGLLADAVSLPWALSTLVLGAVVVFVLARRAAGPTAGVAARPASEAVAA